MNNTCILSGDLKIFVHHIYELQKGMRSMVLCTLEKKDETFALQRLEKLGITYYVHTINPKRINLFFGKKMFVTYISCYASFLSSLCRFFCAVESISLILFS